MNNVYRYRIYWRQSCRLIFAMRPSATMKTLDICWRTIDCRMQTTCSACLANARLRPLCFTLGMALRPDGAPADGHHRVHINKLWTEFITFANDRSGAHYASKMTDVSNPFDDWDVNQRYHHRSGITSEVIEKHRQAAIKTRQVLENAVLNGDVI